MSWQFTTNAEGDVVDMLKTAQAQVGMDEDEYTTALDMSKLTPEQIKRAEALAKEIETGRQVRLPGRCSSSPLRSEPAGELQRGAAAVCWGWGCGGAGAGRCPGGQALCASSLLLQGVLPSQVVSSVAGGAPGEWSTGGGALGWVWDLPAVC